LKKSRGGGPLCSRETQPMAFLGRKKKKTPSLGAVIVQSVLNYPSSPSQKTGGITMGGSFQNKKGTETRPSVKLPPGGDF